MISTRYAVYAVGLLSVVHLINYMDRFVLMILLEPIRLEFGLDDSQAGLLSGLAFALVYTGLALPAARLADRSSRRKLLSAMAGFWSVMTGLCGLAVNFPMLLIARLGIGVGEAGVLPTIHSLISDMVAPHRRGLAMAILATGATLGSTIGLGLGGWISETHGWRAVFLLAMGPGLVASALVFLTLRDPIRGVSDGVTAESAPPRLGEALGVLWRRRAYRYSVIGISLVAVTQLGTSAWQPAFFVRVHGMSQGQTGAMMSLAYGVASAGGVLVGGVVNDLLHRFDKRLSLAFIGVSIVASGLIWFVMFGWAEGAMIPVMLWSACFAGALWSAPFYAMQQSLSGVRLRVTGSAVGMIGFNLLGQGFGPLIVGMISDHLAPTAGVDSLRYALMILQVFGFVGLGIVMLSLPTLTADLEAAVAVET